MSEKNSRFSSLQKHILILTVKIVGIVLTWFALLFCIFGLSYAETNVMSPSISGNDLVLSYHLDRNFAKGDAVVYRCNDKKCVGRIFAVAGDTVEVDSEERIFLNDNLEDSKYYLRNVFPSENAAKYPMTIGEGEVYILGDNRLEYDDSRSFGAVKTSDIEGRIIGIFRTHGI